MKDFEELLGEAADNNMLEYDIATYPKELRSAFIGIGLNNFRDGAHWARQEISDRAVPAMLHLEAKVAQLEKTLQQAEDELVQLRIELERQSDV